MPSSFVEIIQHPFTLGLILGLVFCGIIIYRLVHLKVEFSRYKRHLSDKLEIEADLVRTVRHEKQRLERENENLRIKVAALNEQPGKKLQRELEIYGRTEKRMTLSAPGFASAWEAAKSEVMQEIEDEEAGRSLPKKIFTKFFPSGQREELEASGRPRRLLEPSPETEKEKPDDAA